MWLRLLGNMVLRPVDIGVVDINPEVVDKIHIHRKAIRWAFDDASLWVWWWFQHVEDLKGVCSTIVQGAIDHRPSFRVRGPEVVESDLV